MSLFPFTYKPDATVLVMGIGLMGQHMASNVLSWLDVKKLVIADHAETILSGTEEMTLTDFAASIARILDVLDQRLALIDAEVGIAKRIAAVGGFWSCGSGCREEHRRAEGG